MLAKMIKLLLDDQVKRVVIGESVENSWNNLNCCYRSINNYKLFYFSCKNNTFQFNNVFYSYKNLCLIRIFGGSSN